MLSARWASGLRRRRGVIGGTAATPSWRFPGPGRRMPRAPNTSNNCGSCSTPLTAGTILPGLQVDTDLRWSLLHRLVIIGARATRTSPPSLIVTTQRPGGVKPPTPWPRAPPSRPRPTRGRRQWNQMSCPTRSCGRPWTVSDPAGAAELVRPYVGRYLEAIPTLGGTHDGHREDDHRTVVPRLLADAEIADDSAAGLNDAELPPAPRAGSSSKASPTWSGAAGSGPRPDAGQAARRH